MQTICRSIWALKVFLIGLFWWVFLQPWLIFFFFSHACIMYLNGSVLSFRLAGTFIQFFRFFCTVLSCPALCLKFQIAFPNSQFWFLSTRLNMWYELYTYNVQFYLCFYLLHKQFPQRNLIVTNLWMINFYIKYIDVGNNNNKSKNTTLHLNLLLK